MVKYEAKPEEKVMDHQLEETKVEPPKPDKQDKPEELDELDELFKPEKRKEEDLKLEELTLELELRAKETKLGELKEEEPKKPAEQAKPAEPTKQPGEYEPVADVDPKPEVTESEQPATEAEKPPPSPLGGESSGDGEKHKEDESSEVSDPQSSRLSLTSPEFDQIIAGTHWSSEPAPTSPAAALDEILNIEKTMEQLEADLSGIEVEDKGETTPPKDQENKGESPEVKEKEPAEPEIPAEPEKPSVVDEVLVSPSPGEAEVARESPQPEVKGEPERPVEEIKVPKVSPKPAPKPRSADAPASERYVCTCPFI